MKRLISRAFLACAVLFLGVSASSAQYSQNFETDDGTGDCHSRSAVSRITSGANLITGAASVQTQQLSNPAANTFYELPWLYFGGSTNLVFNHKRSSTSSGNITIRVTYFDAATNTPVTADAYVYNNAADVNRVNNTSFALNLTGVYRLRISWHPVGGGNARGAIDDISIAGATRSTVGANQPASSSQCAALIPGVLPPVAVNDSLTTAINVVAVKEVLTNDTTRTNPINPATVDLNSATAAQETSFAIVGQGTFTTDASGAVSFTPETNFTGTATVNYTVKDSAGATSNAAAFSVTQGAATAAHITVRGRVLDANGRGVSRAQVSLTDSQTGAIFYSQTNPLGYFAFADIEIERIVFVTVNHKRFRFAPESIVTAAREEDLILFQAVASKF